MFLHNCADRFRDAHKASRRLPARRTMDCSLRQCLWEGLADPNDAESGATQRGVYAQNDCVGADRRTQACGEDGACRASAAADPVLQLFKLLRRDAHFARVPNRRREVEERSDERLISVVLTTKAPGHQVRQSFPFLGAFVSWWLSPPAINSLCADVAGPIRSPRNLSSRTSALA
jgi:hypothetical protein